MPAYSLRLVTVSLVALAATTLTGCGGSSDNGSPPARLTISQLLGEPQYDPSQSREQDAQIQDLIATCMTEEGWEYIPVQYPDSYYTPVQDDERARREREGYGIAYWTLNPGGQGGIILPDQTWVDPNQAIVDAMTDAERTAYYESLYGPQQPVMYEEGAASSAKIAPSVGPSISSDRGCQGEASDAVYGVTPDRSEEYWNAVNRFYEDLSTRVAADPGIKALDTAWGECMHGKGLDYDVPNDIWEKAYSAFQERFNQIIGPDFYVDPMAGWTQDQVDAFWATATQEQIDALYVQPELTDAQRTGLEALLADEITTAVAEYDCNLPYNENYSDVYSQIEEDYATQHRAEIEALTLEGGA